jgi:hypothetical protein
MTVSAVGRELLRTHEGNELTIVSRLSTLNAYKHGLTTLLS